MWPSEWQLSYVALINAIYFVTSATGCVCVKYLVSEVWKIVTSIYLSCSLCDMWQVSATLALFTLNCFLSAVCAQRRKEALYCQVRLFPAGHLEWKNAVLECCMENPALGGKREMVPVGGVEQCSARWGGRLKLHKGGSWICGWSLQWLFQNEPTAGGGRGIRVSLLEILVWEGWNHEPSSS